MRWYVGKIPKFDIPILDKSLLLLAKIAYFFVYYFVFLYFSSLFYYFFLILPPILNVMSLWDWYGRVRLPFTTNLIVITNRVESSIFCCRYISNIV